MPMPPAENSEPDSRLNPTVQREEISPKFREEGTDKLSAQAYSFGDVWTNTYSTAVVADMNDDGSDDLVFRTNQGISIVMNNGAGNFGGEITLAPVFSAVDNLTVTDLNGDGQEDIAAIDSGCLVTFLNNGDGTFSNTASVSLNSPSDISPGFLL